MTWNLEEFFKDKNECLREINKLNTVYKKVCLFENCDLKLENNLFGFLFFYEKYNSLREEFVSYLELLNLADYRNNDLNVIKMKFNQVSDLIEKKFEDIFSFILENECIELYKDNVNYKKCKKILDDYYSKGTDEVERHVSTFDILMNDVESNDINIMLLKHTFLDLINNYFCSLSEVIEESYEDYIFECHEEIEKKDFVNLTNQIKENNSVNSSYFSLSTEYIPKNIKVDYNTSKKMVSNGLAPLGYEYNLLLRQSLNDDSIDYQVRKYKSKGNMTYMPLNHRAFANINFYNDLESVLTLAHEIGHMQSHNFKVKNNKNSNPVVPICEFYSLTNELLVGHDILKNSNTLDEKISISYELMDMYYINLFKSLSQAEFALLVGREIDKKSYIDLKTITSLSNKIIKKYNLYNDKTMWIDRNLFEYLNVIYYAYGIIGASNIYGSIKDKTFNIKDFMEALKSSDNNNFEVFDKMGCNPTDPDVIKKAIDNYSNLIENTRDLVYEKKKRR